MSYKFVLDTNILQIESIEKLKAADLNNACLSGRFALYVTPVLLKERLDFITSSDIPPTARESILFLATLKWQRTFRELSGSEGIYTMELEGKLPSEYVFDNSLKNIQENLLQLAAGGCLTEEAIKEIEDEKNQWREKKKKNKETYSKMRQDIDKKLRENPSWTRKGSGFSSFLEDNFEKTAIEKIENSINSVKPKEYLIDYWKANKNRCPYFNKFIEGWLYTAWHAMAQEQTPKIDFNAYEDIEHLVYLKGVDCIVSNEKRFMKKACSELFPKKDFLSVDQFIERLKSKT